MSEIPEQRPRGAAGLGPRPADSQPSPGRARRVPRSLLVIVGLVLLAATTVLIVVALDRKASREAREAVEQRATLASERRRLARIQAPHRGAARDLRPRPGATRAQRLAARTELLDAARQSILEDARLRVRSGELKGPIIDVTCGPYARDPAAKPDHLVLSHSIGRYDCLAVQRRDIKGAALGNPFVAALDFKRFTYVWCRNTPPPSEKAKSLAFVRLDRACYAARGKALGTGYALTPSEARGD